MLHVKSLREHAEGARGLSDSAPRTLCPLGMNESTVMSSMKTSVDVASIGTTVAHYVGGLMDYGALRLLELNTNTHHNGLAMVSVRYIEGTRAGNSWSCARAAQMEDDVAAGHLGACVCQRLE